LGHDIAGSNQVPRPPKVAAVRSASAFCRLVCLLGFSWLSARAAGDDPAGRLVILANSRQPESVRLAEFYAEKRAVPPGNIVVLPLPETESITWREFIDQVWQPVQDELLRRGWIDGMASDLLDRFGRRRFAPGSHRISYLVVCRGVPLRIYNDPTLLEDKPGRKLADPLNKNEAAVDSELSLVAQGGHELAGFVPNPLVGKGYLPGFNPTFVVKVTRLDGPTWDSARHLVTSALEAERTGLLGRVYIDLRGPHPEGDIWLEAVRKQVVQLGFDCDVEDTAATFDGATRFDAPALYFGWYAGNLNGPFAREGFRFPAGAVALHIHSYSAVTLRSEVSGWAGPLVAHGVAATVGNVFEPYLGFTHRPDLLLHALAAGRNFGDAAYAALPALSWQAVAVGDPLYRPFKVPLEAQGNSGYAVIRRANLLRHEGKKTEAIALLRAAQRDEPSLAVGLALARHLLAAQDAPGAVAALGFAPLLKNVRPEDWPLLREAAGLLAAHGARPVALQVYANLAAARAPTPSAHRALLGEARAAADAAGDLGLSLEFARRLNELGEPAVK
jgi:uncharacterized protein (TIGR03790 family)